ncbi:MAG TPA: serine/threonine dehydratase [Streptosporangiaceae bacterium]|nr:serine/threonine dehydratase [Streptosporangiaceae bacterium]
MNAGIPANDVTSQVTQETIRCVEPLLRPHVRQTPVVAVDLADFGLAGGGLVLKLEHLQHTGSFKVRGAFANLLLRPVPEAGVVAASGGNHGAAVAYAAHALGIPARVFVPRVSSPAKTARIRAYGADLVIGGESYDEALTASRKWAAEAGALEVHAFDQPETMLGTGTVAAELAVQAPEVSCVVAAVGGGGLLGGIAAWYGGRATVVGAEPEEAPTLTYALRAGQPVDAPAGGIAMDSLAPRQIGALTFGVLSHYGAQAALVSEEAIRGAQRLLWDKLRLVAEPGGCAALAAVLSGRFAAPAGVGLAVVVSGANTTSVDFSLQSQVHAERLAARTSMR